MNSHYLKWEVGGSSGRAFGAEETACVTLWEDLMSTEELVKTQEVLITGRKDNVCGSFDRK